MAQVLSLAQMSEQNPAEYLIYMWYLESMVRGLPEDVDFERFLAQAPDELPVLGSLKELLSPLRKAMQEEGIMNAPEKHTAPLSALLEKLETLHKFLLTNEQEQVYEGVYMPLLPAIVEIRKRSGGHTLGEVEAALVALYGYTFLKQQHQETNPATQEIMKKICLWLKVLGEKYMQS